MGEIRRLGDRALLIGTDGAVAARVLARAIRAAGIGGLADVVIGMATVMVAFEPGDVEVEVDLDARRSLLSHLAEEVSVAQETPGASAFEVLEGSDDSLFVLPCAFDGPDLAEVAAIAGCSPATVIELVTAQVLTVAVVGFSPGFAYLAGLPEELGHIPRRPRPRPSVPAGSLALANGHAAVYPTTSPGGWQLIGRTPEPLFTPWEPPYARLAPGDRVRFTVATVAAEAVEAPSISGAPVAADPAGQPAFEVEQPGVWTVLQDGGRRGMAALGVPAATAADPYSFRLANDLVGNPVDACALEITARGPTLRCLRSTFVAVVGGRPDLRLEGQPVAAGRVVPISAGQTLAIGPVRGGFRCYLAVAGGFVGSPVLGSCASDQLAGLGPGPLVRGARLWAATLEPPLGDHLRDGVMVETSENEAVALRVVPGPHGERFAAGAFEALVSARFIVGPESNRVGLRLRRDAHSYPSTETPAPEVTGELDSQGVVTGAVQVPPNGDPVILLTDHATLGGYPVIAVVAEVDHGRLGQCAPGQTVVFVPIDPGEARAALRAQRRLVETAVVGSYPLAVD